MSKPTFEVQVLAGDASHFYMTITICANGSQWTSQPAELSATDWAAARQEAGTKAVSFRQALLGVREGTDQS